MPGATYDITFRGHGRSASEAAQQVHRSVSTLKGATIETGIAARESAAMQVAANRAVYESLRLVVAESHSAARAASSHASGISRLERGALAGSGAFRGMGRSIAFASGAFLGAAGFASVARTSIELGGALNREIEQSTVVFGKSAGAVQSWSKTTAASMGISRVASLDMANALGQMIGRFDIGPRKALEMSKALAQLASDIGRVQGVDPEQVAKAEVAALAGRTRALSAYGLKIDETRIKEEARRANLGQVVIDTDKVKRAEENLAIRQAEQAKALKDYTANSTQYLTATHGVEDAQKAVAKAYEGTVGPLTAAQREQAVYNLMLQQSAGIHRKAAQEADSLHARWASLRAEVADLEAGLGQALIPVVSDYVDEAAKWLGQTENQERVQRLLTRAVQLFHEGVQDAVPVIRDLAGIVQTAAGAVGGFKNLLELLLALKVVSIVSGWTAAIGGRGGRGGLLGALTGVSKTWDVRVAVAVAGAAAFYELSKELTKLRKKYGILDADKGPDPIELGTVTGRIAGVKLGGDQPHTIVYNQVTGEIQALFKGMLAGTLTIQQAAKLMGESVAALRKQIGAAGSPTRPGDFSPLAGLTGSSTLYGTQLKKTIAALAAQRGLDPAAVLAVAQSEGAFRGSIGDHGTSFGPFQLHKGGALPAGKGAAWAQSLEGLTYALDMIAKVAGGLKGQPAISAIVNRFEHPAAPGAEVARAAGYYGSFTGIPTGGKTTSKAGGRSKLVQMAMSMLGKPYLWGGETPGGFDCSGFVEWVFAQEGITVPRTSQEQFQSGQVVSRKNLRPGDLVFTNMQKDGPHHVGIYAGQGQVVESHGGPWDSGGSHRPGDVVRTRSLDDFGFGGARRYGGQFFTGDTPGLTVGEKPPKKHVAVAPLLPVGLRVAASAAALTKDTADDLAAIGKELEYLRGRLKTAKGEKRVDLLDAIKSLQDEQAGIEKDIADAAREYAKQLAQARAAVAKHAAQVGATIRVEGISPEARLGDRGENIRAHYAQMSNAELEAMRDADRRRAALERQHAKEAAQRRAQLNRESIASAKEALAEISAAMDPAKPVTPLPQLREEIRHWRTALADLPKGAKAAAAEVRRHLAEAVSRLPASLGSWQSMALAKQSAFSNAFQRVSARILSAFDRETQKHLAQMSQQVQDQVAAIQEAGQALTPGEEALGAFRDARAQAERARQRADLQAQLAAATDPAEQARIQQQLNDMLLDEQEAALAKTADAERRGRDKSTQAQIEALQKAEQIREQDYQDQREAQRQALEDQLADWQVALANKTSSWEDFIKWLAGQNAGGAFGSEIPDPVTFIGAAGAAQGSAFADAFIAELGRAYDALQLLLRGQDPRSVGGSKGPAKPTYSVGLPGSGKGAQLPDVMASSIVGGQQSSYATSTAAGGGGGGGGGQASAGPLIGTLNVTTYGGTDRQVHRGLAAALAPYLGSVSYPSPG